MIVDGIGTVLQFWPLTLVAGQSSQVLAFTIDNPSGPTAHMSASHHANLKVWAKRVADMSYVDISVSPYNLSGVSAGPTNMLLYVEAVDDIIGFERDPVSVIVGSSSAAGWVS